MVQNATFNEIFQKIAVNESGTPRTREHVYGGVVCSFQLGLVFLRTKPLRESGLMPQKTPRGLIEFEAPVVEFRTVDSDELIIRAEEASVSGNVSTFTRDTVWSKNLNFDATWFVEPGDTA
ncbi:MAG TPA: hypothetical protein DEQ43_09775 [Nocardioides bacterium]|nr:hypothetical protein [Nocardioides sp.]